MTLPPALVDDTATQPPDAAVADLVRRVDPERLRALTVALVEIPSPSGHEAAVAERYAAALDEYGLDVEIDREFPESPTVVARLAGPAGGRVLQFDGHTDTVAQPHAPPYEAGGRIYGRGASDMKSGLAAMGEAARVLRAAELPLNGGLLLTAHGQHEDPVPPHDLHAPLLALFRRGIVGDAALIPEGPSHEAVVAGKGLCSFEIVFEREGQPMHEVLASEGVPNPILAGTRLVQLLEDRAREWRGRPDPFLGPETCFVGIFEAGDYFNRIPSRCRLAGTRRYPAERTAAGVIQELEALVRQVERDFPGVSGRVRATPSGQGFRVDPEEPVVQALRAAYRDVVGRALPLGGMSLIGNASQFNTIARVPTLYHGVDQATAHSDCEHVALSDVVRTAQVLVAAAIRYLGAAA
jgi:acetylornithine deacetylase/succinyl-diaminopimelate desuccinylase-like protein